MNITGRIDSKLENLGYLEDPLDSANLGSLLSALTFIEDVDSIEMFSEIKGSLIGMSATMTAVGISIENLLISHVTETANLEIASEKGSENLHFLVELSPLRIESHGFPTRSIGAIAKFEINKSHIVWVKLGWRSRKGVDAGRKSQILKLASALARPGFELLNKLCCLDHTCNPLDLKIPSNENVDNITDVPEKESVSRSNLNLINSMKRLTEFELAIITLMTEGKSNPEIARELFVSPSTIRNTSSIIYNKIGARNRQHAVAMFTSFTSLERERDSKY